MTNFETALKILSQHLPTVRQALAFREWLETYDLLRMGAVGIEIAPHKLAPQPDFDAIRRLFSKTTFHALEGRYDWDTDLLNYFRRRAGDVQWLESLARQEK